MLGKTNHCVDWPVVFYFLENQGCYGIIRATAHTSTTVTHHLGTTTPNYESNLPLMTHKLIISVHGDTLATRWQYLEAYSPALEPFVVSASY